MRTVALNPGCHKGSTCVSAPVADLQDPDPEVSAPPEVKHKSSKVTYEKYFGSIISISLLFV